MKDAYVHVTKIKKWDICAGDAILRALGGTLTDLDGREVDYREASSTILSNSHLASKQVSLTI